MRENGRRKHWIQAYLQGAEARLFNMAAWSVTSGSGGNGDMSCSALIVSSSILISLLFSCFLPSSFLLFPITDLHSQTEYGHLLSTLTGLTGEAFLDLMQQIKLLHLLAPFTKTGQSAALVRNSASLNHQIKTSSFCALPIPKVQVLTYHSSPISKVGQEYSPFEHQLTRYIHHVISCSSGPWVAHSLSPFNQTHSH